MPTASASQLPMAVSWGIDYRRLRLYLTNNYTALPRGRVSLGAGTSDVKQWYVLHGARAPVKDGLTGVLAAFNLAAMNRDKRVQLVVDEHETQLATDRQRFQEATGLVEG